MRELVYFVAVSLDGYIASPDGTFEAFGQDGDHLDWIVHEYPDTLPTAALHTIGITPTNNRFDTVLMGWNTYAAGLPSGVTDPYQHLHQYVFSRSHDKADGDIVVTDRDPVEVVRELKAERAGSDIWLCGGGQLASTLSDEINRLVLKVNPVLFGAGIPAFAGRTYEPRTLTRVASLPFTSGVVVNEYACSATPRPGPRLIRAGRIRR